MVDEVVSRKFKNDQIMETRIIFALRFVWYSLIGMLAIILFPLSGIVWIFSGFSILNYALLGLEDYNTMIFTIFNNHCYSGDFSIRYLGKYLYINPVEFDGAGLSNYMDRCASFKTIEDANKFIIRWMSAKKLNYKFQILSVS